jgi:polar amino acid transport system substrate-binding protein
MQQYALAALFLCMAVLPAAAAGGVSPDVLKDLAPTGKMRAAINFGNMVLAQKDPKTGEAKGITPDLARELARRLGVPVELVPFDSAGAVFAAGKTGGWDIAFIAIEPVRAAEIEFTAPYVIIEGTYMVTASSPLKTVADVDHPGKRIAVNVGSAYDLYLTRNLKNAALVRSDGSKGKGPDAFDIFMKDKLDAVAGVRQALAAYADKHPGMRIMQDRFMDIRQAMGTPKGRLAGVGYLKTFIEDVKASGFVADALKRSGQSASVAPAAQ